MPVRPPSLIRAVQPLLALALALALPQLLGACGEDEPVNGGALVDAGDAALEAVDVAGELTSTVDCASCGSACREEAWIYAKTWHDPAPIHYKEKPPSAGIHDGCWYPWGVSATPVPPRRFVHNLEHGGLVLTYDCPDGCAKDVLELQAAAEASTRPFIVTPFAGAARRIVALCWEHRLLLDCVDAGAKDAIIAFAKLHCPNAPEQVMSGPPDGCMK